MLVTVRVTMVVKRWWWCGDEVVWCGHGGVDVVAAAVEANRIREKFQLGLGSTVTWGVGRVLWYCSGVLGCTVEGCGDDGVLARKNEHLDEGFTATAYPKVQENLKLAVEEKVLLEEPTSSSGTLSSLQHLSRDISFGDQFFGDKPLDADKNAETEVESMVNVLIQQALSSISLMTSPILDLTSRPESPKVHHQFKATTTDTTTTTTTLPPPQAQQQSTTEAIMVKCIEQLDIPQQVSITVSKVVMDARMWETESYKTHEDHTHLFKALEKSMNRDHSEELTQDLDEARKKKKKSRESPKTPPGSPSHQPPPPPPPAGPSGPSGAPGASGSPQVPPPPPPPSSTSQESPSKASAVPSPSKTAASTGDVATFIDWFCKRRGITELKPQDLEGPAYEIVNVFHPNVIHLQYQMEECHKLLTDSVDDPLLRHNVIKPLPLGGPPGQVTIQSDFFFNKDLEYLRYGSKGRRPALSISKMKATYYPDAELEQRFYIDRHTSEGDRRAVRTHMRILSVARIEFFSMYGYDCIKKIVLRRVDLNEHVITERYFKEQVDHDLLSLQKPKKKSPADQYIFQRRVSEPTGSSGYDESPYAVLGQSDSEEELKKTGSDAGNQDEGQPGSNPDEISKGQAELDPDEEFTAMAYPKVQENLKLAVEDQVLLEEPASLSGTLSSLQHMSRDISFGDLFFSNKPLDVDKNAETKVESMVNVPIQQALSSISLMTSSIIDLTSRPESPKVHQQYKATTTDTTTTTTKLPPPQAQQQSTAEAMMMKRIALEKSMNRDHSEELAQDLAEARKKNKKSRESPKMPPGSPSHQPPPPPLPAGPFGSSGAPGASGSSQLLPPPPPPSSTNQE
nr:hypothetical protein [Tanacetum cinerariifolium]